MAEVGTYYITIMPEMSQFTGSVTSALKGAGQTGGKTYGTSFMDIVKGSALGTTLGNLASKAGGTIASGFNTGISRLDTIKNYPKVMESLGYSTDDADKSIKTIMGHLDGLPTATQDMVTLTQSISDSTGDLDLATDAALGFNDMMLANGASAAEVATAQGVLNRVLGKGSATAAQWQSLTSVMPAQLGMVARSMLGAGASTEDLHTALEDGTVSWNDFLQAIADLDKNGYIDESGKKIASFEEQARANSHGIGTAIDNIRNRIGAGWAEILDKVGQEEISGTIDKMSYGVKSGMYLVADAVGYVKEQIGKTKIAENLGKILTGIGDAFSKIDTGELKKFADVVIGMIDGALQWIVDNGDLVSTLLVSIGAAIGTVGTFLGMIDLAAKLGLLAGTPGLIQAVWAALSANPFAVLIGVIAAVTAGLVWFFTQTETGQALWQGFCDLMSGLWEGLKQDFQNLIETIKQRMEESAAQWEVFKGNVKGVIDAIVGFFLNLKQDFDNMVARIKQNLADNAVQWQKFKENVGKAIENLKTTLGNIWAEIKRIATNEWNAIKNAVGIIVNGIKTTITNIWNAIKTTVTTTMGNIKTGVTNAWNNIKTSVGGVVDSIKSTISEKFNAAKTAVLGIFDNIKNGIRDKIQWAKDQVSNIVERIKGLFNFSWSLPAPKLPHITWGWTDVGGIVSIPSFGIEWYGKGGVFDAATLIGIGEKGKEAALPLNAKTYGEIAKGISGELGAGVTITGNQFVVREEADIDRIADALDRKIRRERMAMA